MPAALTASLLLLEPCPNVCAYIAETWTFLGRRAAGTGTASIDDRGAMLNAVRWHVCLLASARSRVA